MTNYCFDNLVLLNAQTASYADLLVPLCIHGKEFTGLDKIILNSVEVTDKIKGEESVILSQNAQINQILKN